MPSEATTISSGVLTKSKQLRGCMTTCLYRGRWYETSASGAASDPALYQQVARQRFAGPHTDSAARSLNARSMILKVSVICKHGTRSIHARVATSERGFECSFQRALSQKSRHRDVHTLGAGALAQQERGLRGPECCCCWWWRRTVCADEARGPRRRSRPSTRCAPTRAPPCRRAEPRSARATRGTRAVWGASSVGSRKRAGSAREAPLTNVKSRSPTPAPAPTLTMRKSGQLHSAHVW